jgi:uncharacterized membrane protein
LSATSSILSPLGNRMHSHRTAKIVRWILAVFFVAAGANHFRSPETYLGMMPAWLPAPLTVNAVAGVAEILGGLGLVVPPTRRFAAWGLIALLVAVFPANVHVALLGHMPGFNFSPTVLWLRLPFQGVFIVGVWWVGLSGRARTVV